MDETHSSTPLFLQQYFHSLRWLGEPMDNFFALEQFVEFNKIKRDAMGRCRFRADVVIQASGNGGAETVDALISLSSSDQFGEQLALTSTGNFIAGKLPLGYKTDFGEWTHRNGVLIIKGNYRKMFDYKTEIRPA